ncbi:hypothetical protein GGF43_002250 [Coemansia sp. RSA 2618]|nr:hypothetical protein GGF43_002250 [Coemansia sp. RSA 2618]
MQKPSRPCSTITPKPSLPNSAFAPMPSRPKSAVLADVPPLLPYIAATPSPGSDSSCPSLHMMPLEDDEDRNDGVVPCKRHDSGNGRNNEHLSSPYLPALKDGVPVPRITLSDDSVDLPHTDMAKSCVEMLEQVQRSMSTVWRAGRGHSRAGSSLERSHEQLASPTTDTPRGDQSSALPRLVPRMAPEPTVPREPEGTHTLGQYLPANAGDLDAVMAAVRRPRSHHVWSLKPVASAFLGGLHSRRGSALGLAGAQSVPVSPRGTQNPMPAIPPNSPTDPLASIDGDTSSSTAADSHLSLVINNHPRMQRQMSDVSTRNSIASSAAASSTDNFLVNDLPQMNAYVDPYTSQALELGHMEPPLSADAANYVADKRLVELGSATLRSMLGDVALDRERLSFIHECLRLGGITAATVWYSLPWLHFELLQFDSARRRLIALLLGNANTCPPDALRHFAATTTTVDEAAAMRAMSERERAEYMKLMSDLYQGVHVVPLKPAQAWRLVVKPVVSRDPDLFYSDFKQMVVGVAKWELISL